MSAKSSDGASEVDLLARSGALLYETLSGLSEAQMDSRPTPAEWSAWDIAYHVTQIEVWYHAKLCEASASDRSDALQQFVDAWRHLRAASLTLAAAIPGDRLDRDALLSGVPDWTPRELLERIAAHDAEHAAQAAVASGRQRESGFGNRESDGDALTREP